MVLISMGSSMFIDHDYTPTPRIAAMFEEEFGEGATRDSIPEGWVCEWDKQALFEILVPADPRHAMTQRKRQPCPSSR